MFTNLSSQVFPLPDSPSFQQRLHSIPQFSELKDSSTFPPNRTRYQEFVRRYMQPETPYDELLLFHYMGCGKTRTAALVAETCLKKGFKRALVILRNTALQETFENEILIVNPDYCANLDDNLGKSPDQIREMQFRANRSLISRNYVFYTMGTCESIQVEEFEDHVIIIDEVQILIGMDVQYAAIHRLLHTLHNRKILLLSGTPMPDTADEFALVMNLILPLSQQLPTGAAFTRLFFDRSRLVSSELLERRIRGRVSYVNSEFAAQPKYVGNFDHCGLQIYKSQMSQYQSQICASHAGNVNDAYLHKQIQVALFAFPPKLKCKSSILRRMLADGGLDLKDRIQMISKYSCKYATILKCIVSNPTHKVFVYMESIHEGGALTFASCLEIVGVRSYVVVHSKMSQESSRKAIASFSSESGPRILIGGRMLQTGYSFQNVSQIHVAMPPFNVSGLRQAIARVCRINSCPNRRVSVFLHAAVGADDKSIDMHIYSLAMRKYSLVQQIEELVQRTAIDATCDITENPPKTVQKTIQECKNQIQQMFLKSWAYHVDEMCASGDMIDALLDMISRSTPVRDPYGIPHTIQRRGDILYLSRILGCGDISDTLYSRYPEHTLNLSLDYAVSQILATRTESLLRQLSLDEMQRSQDMQRSQEMQRRREIVSLLDATVVNMMVEKIMLDNLLKGGKSGEFHTWLLSKYEKFIYAVEPHRLVSLCLPDSVRVLDCSTWIDGTAQDIMSVVKFLGLDKYPSFIRHVPNRNAVYLVRRNKNLKGRVCLTMSKQELCNVLLEVDKDTQIPKNASKTWFCNEILHLYKKLNRVLYAN